MGNCLDSAAPHPCEKDEPAELRLSADEAKALYFFLLDCGYICTERHMAIHEFWKKLKFFVEKQ